MEVNPKTGNIWGCFKCGGKKIQGAAKPYVPGLGSVDGAKWDQDFDQSKKKPLL